MGWQAKTILIKQNRIKYNEMPPFLPMMPKLKRSVFQQSIGSKSFRLTTKDTVLIIGPGHSILEVTSLVDNRHELLLLLLL